MVDVTRGKSEVGAGVVLDGDVDGLVLEASHSIATPALLVKSRIAEGLGNRMDAVRLASAFLVAFDKAPPSQKPLLDEARSRIARLKPSDARRTQ